MHPWDLVMSRFRGEKKADPDNDVKKAMEDEKLDPGRLVTVDDARETLGMSAYQVVMLAMQSVFKAYSKDGGQIHPSTLVWSIDRCLQDPLLDGMEILEMKRRFDNEGRPVPPEDLVSHARPVKEAAKLAKSQPGMLADKAKKETERLVALRSNLLAVEEDAKKTIDARLKEIDVLQLNALYPTLDLSFLKWRRKSDGWPVFAYFSPDKPECKLWIEVSHYGSYDNGAFPNINFGGFWLAQQFYKDVYPALRLRGNPPESQYNANYVAIETRFAGVLPNQTRENIIDCRKAKMFDDILIIGEATWRLENKVIDKDPLVVGVKHGKAWLIDVFDLTPAEEIVRCEWAVSPPLKTQELW